eukprot:538837_1
MSLKRYAPCTVKPPIKRNAVDVVGDWVYESIEENSDEWKYFRDAIGSPYIDVHYIYKYVNGNHEMRKKAIIHEEWLNTLSEYKQKNILAKSSTPNNYVELELDYILMNPIMQMDEHTKKTTAELFPNYTPLGKFPERRDYQSFGSILNQMGKYSEERELIVQTGIKEMLQAYQFLFKKVKQHTFCNLLENYGGITRVLTNIILAFIGYETDFKICESDDERDYFVNTTKDIMPSLLEQWTLVNDYTRCLYLSWRDKDDCILPYACEWRFYKINKIVYEVTAIFNCGEMYPDYENYELLYEPEFVEEMYKYEFTRTRDELLQNDCVYNVT